METFLPMIRQPAVWVNPSSYPGDFDGEDSFFAINKLSVLRKAIPTRLYPVDLVAVHSQEPEESGIVAEEYAAGATLAVNESTYTFDDGRTVTFKMAASSSYVPTNKQADYRDGEYTPDEFVRGTIADALSMYMEKMLVLGDAAAPGNLQPDGIIQSAIPKLTLDAAGAVTPHARLLKITRAAGMIRTGGGHCEPDLLICAPQATELIALDVGSVFGDLENTYISGSGQPSFYVPTPYGKLLVAPSEFIEIGAGPAFATKLYVAHTQGPMGLHIGVAGGSPGIEIEPFQHPDKPGYSLVGTVKFALMAMDSGKLVEITNFSVA